MKTLNPGTRVRLNVRSIGGWKGTGTVVGDYPPSPDSIRLRKDGLDETVQCMRHEVSVLRNQNRGEAAKQESVS
jgi:hypothetical protein